MSKKILTQKDKLDKIILFLQNNKYDKEVILKNKKEKLDKLLQNDKVNILNNNIGTLIKLSNNILNPSQINILKKELDEIDVNLNELIKMKGGKRTYKYIQGSKKTYKQLKNKHYKNISKNLRKK